MPRRPGRYAAASVLPGMLFVAFGTARVVAPVSALGLLFDEPVAFAVAAGVVSLAGAVLLFARPVELVVARTLFGSTRPPAGNEVARLQRLLLRVGSRSGLSTGGLIMRIEPGSGVNASAGAAHLLFVTEGALALPDQQLEAMLAHELGHHRGLHPVFSAVIWWLRLPGSILASVYRLLRQAVGVLGAAWGRFGRLLVVPLRVLLIAWQLAVMWVYYAAELLALQAARISEYEADAAAASWGYARDLVGAYQAIGHRLVEPAALSARLMADHPPLAMRIRRLNAGRGSDDCGSGALDDRPGSDAG